MRVPPFLCLLLLLLGCTPAGAVDYATHIKPILRARCYSCHGALKQKSDLRLDTVEAMRRGGKDGLAIQPGAPEKSHLLERVSSHDEEERMPPEGEPLTAAQIAAISVWIAEGAPAPANEQPEPDPHAHWAFQRPLRPPLPKLGEEAAFHPIDALLEAERRAQGVVAQPAASPATLLRRVYFDLIGLPPTRAEQRAFLADTEPDAFERVVDRLLASPTYGERWARHWMDVWRYSDWYGLDAQLRHSQKHIWHWRDWIIESLNADKGYDTMIREMLAGDELAPADPAVLRATGFLARNYFLFNRNTWLEETVEHTGKAFLGLTLNCAKCHAHKFDPIAQEDFYRFRAFFEPHQVRLDPVPGQADLEKDGLPRVFDAHADTPTFLFARGDERHPDKSHALTPGVPEIFNAPPASEPIKLPLTAFAPTTAESVQRDQLALADQQIATALGEVEKALTKSAAASAAMVLSVCPVLSVAMSFEAGAAAATADKGLAAARLRVPMFAASFAADRARLSDPPAADAPGLARAAAAAEQAHALAAAEAAFAGATLELGRQQAAGAKDKITAAEAKLKEATDVLEKARKSAEAPGDSYTSVRVARKAFEGPTEKEADLPAVFPSSSTGRRSALAKWITARENPLTARVAVNHIWLRHFGEPLVSDVTDFGRRSPAPPQQKLLDWLAVEFMESGWSMKHLHRLIITSAAYRMRATRTGAPPANSATDPENRLLWRRAPQRMEGELVRDAALFLAGELDQTIGGPTVSDEDSKRRALYFTRSLNEHPRFLSMFDAPNVLECYRRIESIVPQQALVMSNSKLTLGLAPKIAARIVAESGNRASDAEFISTAFEMLLGAPPTDAEAAESLRGLADLRALHEQGAPETATKKARVQLIHVLLNHNDFVTVR